MGWAARQTGGSRAASLPQHRGGGRADARAQQAAAGRARAAPREVRRAAKRGRYIQLEVRPLPACAGAAPAITGGSRFVVVADRLPDTAAARRGELPAKP